MTYPPPSTWQPDPGAAGLEPSPAAAPVRPTFWQRWAPREDVRAGAVIVGVLAVLGALLGILWQWWSPPAGLGFVVAPGEIQADETENWVAADGRFALICAVVGVVAAIVVWRRRSTRGPVAGAALAVGGLIGAALTAGVGALVGGGSDRGKTGTLLRELPLRVHMHSLLLLEATMAVLVYTLFVSFAVRDDLGRPEPGCEAGDDTTDAASDDAGSVGVDGQLQDGRGDGDTAGGLQ